ncbi:hypothetical protein [Candidatus Poriferisodalis sp.]|uniref:hypothetical protein n=1 Tax=Candidatus Poriferisodalis sp. TaxID=3101277 RepID=UPI003B023AE3
MARPKSRRGGRVTPKGTRPGAGGGTPRLDPQARYLLELLEASATEFAARGPDVDEADGWASGMQEFVAVPHSPEGLQPAQVLAHARKIGGASGAAMTAALGAYGPSSARATARRQLEQMASSGDVPTWATAVGRATPAEAFLWRDEWGEACEITIHYQRPDGRLHGLLVDINWFMCGAARGFELVTEREALASAGRDRPGVEQLSLADARALCHCALDIYMSLDANDEMEPFEEALEFEWPDLGFLAEQRLSLLPEGGTAAALYRAERPDRSAALDEFGRAARPAGEGHDEFSAMTSALRLFGRLCRDGDVLHWTPCRVDLFLESFVPNYSPADGPVCSECDKSHPDVFDAAFMSTVESAFPRWLRFAAEHSGQTKELLDENLHAAADGFEDWRAAAREYRRNQVGTPELWLPRSA